MMIHEKLMSGQFLFDLKNEHNNLLHAASAQHARLSAHQPFLSHHQAYNTSHPLTQHALHQQTHPALPPAAIEQLELYSAYAYQQQQQQQQQAQQLIGSAAQAECASRHQSASEVLDLSRRDSAETTMTVRKTPSPSELGAESPAGSPTQQQLLQTNLLYNAQQQMGRLAPPLASLYPAFYSSIGFAKDATATTTPPLAPASVTPPASNASIYTASQTSPISNNSLAVASAVAAAAAAAGTTPNGMLHNLKTEDVHMTPLSPSSSHDGRSKSPTIQAVNAATNSPTTPSSSSALNALKSTRPFKAFPRDPLVIAANFAATDVLLDNPRVERYTEYRKRVLEQIHSSNGGARTVTNPKMRRMNSRRNSNSSSNAQEGASSEGEERHGAGADESSDCDSSYTGGQTDKVSSSAHASNGEDNKLSAAGNSSSSGGQLKDAAYYERRRKNNAAAKKSRDRRRIKEDEIAIRAAYLERQNIELLCQIDALKAQLAAFTSKAVSA
ncbi:protein giant [Zeugodacus cucurbitae]|uniref:protein giant n=1 Tax=Zeugodacus cucurbitae TaxID=28588 RepID=UPI0023D90AC0|nr:protein giant [Zeugodacus cucurbitae]